MKNRVILVIAVLQVVWPLYAQDSKSATDAQAAFEMYEKRVAEGAQPTLIIKNGESHLTETTTLSAGEFTQFAPALAPAPVPLIYQSEIQALKEQIEALKKLNDGLEKELAACKSKP